MSLASSSLGSPLGSPKRKAPAMTMGPPAKKVKRTTPLEKKLGKLKETFTSLRPYWEDYDPGKFMREICHTREQLVALTPDKVEEFFSSGLGSEVFNALDFLDGQLLEGTPSVGSQPMKRTDSYQKARNDMIAFVRRVRESLSGQS